MKMEISQVLSAKKDLILQTWMSLQAADAALREDLMANKDWAEQSNELLDELLSVFARNKMSELGSGDLDKLHEIIEGISVSRATEGFTPKETGLYIFSLKEALIQVLQQQIPNDPTYLFESSTTLNKLMDSLGILTFETFIKGREQVILRQTDEITEISTPVIRVWQGILALPIIGTLDSARTQVVMENLLQEIVESGSTIAILDISGVPAVDSLVAQHLIKTVAATRLMGAECIISGIRPEIAQTVVHLGIDLSNIVTKATLASALRYAFTLLKLEVKRIQKDNKASS